ncbi:CubicO group peptidase, beta-lactamase class C family [Micromonospora phaseoli]|uniref:CubicO group peptidase, beta-lactamase class C family n=1 Tax=Micromonospora phaseoli TaxID=1144548 RepID=A0A1H7DRC5_9ACTN|nr:serine hydrolase domain-containing protein [Micromonospora phaseoli]PZV89513.1 CubicO group peptidase (beta-lactamase class C family) [Micromonospora phaseoli]GIJ80573.1 serine hydrolase [Micromonospora phaseoli]SEK03407.1 CubicO group peptidase, beta-lactamase class C family [Micromonospora phaseoli]
MPLRPETARQIDALVADAQSTGHVPSLIVGVVRGGGLAHLATAGGRPSPDADLQYRIGSITKTMTAVLIMQERDAGRLALDDPLRRHLPEAAAAGPVTLRQLLGHAGGLQREPDGPWWERSEGVDLATLIAGFGATKIAYPPHRAFHYSNLAYGLLGGALERITRTPWAQLVRERILTPLGMHRTTYAATGPFAPGYVVHPWHDTLREEPRTDTRAMAPAGQLWSTATDLARWAAFLADPDPTVLAPATLDEMCAPVVLSDLDSWRGGYGLGIQLTRVGDRIHAGHGGSMPGYVSVLAVHRRSRTGIIGLANSYGFRTGHISSLGLQILTRVLDAEPEPPLRWRPTDAPPPPDVAELAGRWWWMGTPLDVSWDATTGDLLGALRGELLSRYVPEAPDRWRGRSGPEDGETLTVLRDDAGRPVALDIATFVFTRTPDDEP